MTVDSRTGFFYDLRNKRSGLFVSLPKQSRWPFYVQFEPEEVGYTFAAEVTPDSRQNAVVHTELGDGALSLIFDYKDLQAGVDHGAVSAGDPISDPSTGLHVVMEIRIKPELDYFLIRLMLDNSQGRYPVTGLYSNPGEVLSVSAEPQDESIAVPNTECFGTLYRAPRSRFPAGSAVASHLAPPEIVFNYLGATGGNDLACGWIDYYGPKGGLGIGYVNRQGMTMAFTASRGKDGMALGWKQFDLTGVTTYFGAAGGCCLGTIHPLKPGRAWQTDNWILAPHQGDWHRMADIYRQEYAAAFDDDRLTWERVSPTAKGLDICTSWWITNTKDEVVCTLSEIPSHVAKLITALQIDPERLAVWIPGASTHGFDRLYPDFFPVNSKAGGGEALAAAVQELRSAKVGAIILYTNPNYDHHMASHYVADADTGNDCPLGHYACFASPSWLRMYLDQVAPQVAQFRINDVFMDQFQLIFTVCTQKDHSHGTEVPDILQAQITGKAAFAREVRARLLASQPDAFTSCEMGNDLTTRFVDVWCPEFQSGGKSTGGDRMVPEMVRYTFPAALTCMYSEEMETWPLAFLDGCILRLDRPTSSCPGQIQQYQDEARDPIVSNFVKVRKALRESTAPGYPEGFHDNAGLQVEGSVEARVFRGTDGITVVYYASKAGIATLKLDPAVLGFAHAPRQTYSLRVQDHEYGFRIWHASKG
jgi:hypothetical protein